MVYYYLFGVFYLGKLLLSGFLQLKGKIIWHITVTLYSISYRNYHKTTMKMRFFSSILTSWDFSDPIIIYHLGLGPVPLVLLATLPNSKY